MVTIRRADFFSSKLSHQSAFGDLNLKENPGKKTRSKNLSTRHEAHPTIPEKQKDMICPFYRMLRFDKIRFEFLNFSISFMQNRVEVQLTKIEPSDVMTRCFGSSFISCRNRPAKTVAMGMTQNNVHLFTHISFGEQD
jgi:hypothetical protein